MTHTILSITFEPAIAGVRIDGYAFDCSCGEHAGYSFRAMTEQASRSHADYMNAQESKPRRRARARR